MSSGPDCSSFGHCGGSGSILSPAQWVKVPALPQLRLRCNPWPRNFHGLWMQSKTRKKGTNRWWDWFHYTLIYLPPYFWNKRCTRCEKIKEKISFSRQVYWKFLGTLYKRRVREQELRLSALYCSPSATPLKEKYEGTLENWQESSSLIRQSVICEAILKERSKLSTLNFLNPIHLFYLRYKIDKN